MVELSTPCLKKFVELGKKDTVGWSVETRLVNWKFGILCLLHSTEVKTDGHNILRFCEEKRR